jgi:hypothetical protein
MKKTKSNKEEEFETMSDNLVLVAYDTKRNKMAGIKLSEIAEVMAIATCEYLKRKKVRK